MGACESGDLLAEGKITEEIVANIRSWQHSGFSVDQSVRMEAQATEGLQRLIEHFLRCPFSQARMIEVSERILRHGGLWEEESVRGPPASEPAVC